MKLNRMSALVNVKKVADILKRFLSKTVVPTSSISFFCHLVVTHATVLQIECEANNSRKKRTHTLILR